MKQYLTLKLLISIFLMGCTQTPVDRSNKNKNATKNTTEISSEKLDSKSPNEDMEDKELSVDERVEQIRGWYGEIQKIGMNNCKTKRKTRYERGFSSDSEEFSFEQIVKTCELNEDFELIKGEFSGYEWAQQVSVYKRKDKIFFIFVTGGAESWTYEYRYYFDSDENLIRHLVREADGGDEISGPNTEKKINAKKKYVKDCAKEYFDEIEFVVGRKK